jgi:arylsulfatase A-like enzyme
MSQKKTGMSRAAWRLLWIFAVGLLLFGVGRNVRVFQPQRSLLPIAPLVVSAAVATRDRLPAQPGALRGQNLLVVTLDTVRPDRLGCYGNRAIETPNLDRLCERGVVFSRAVATASSTLPSHASIFTGLYPRHHGARANAAYHLASEQRTLAEILAEKGYETAAFVSSFVLDAKFGLAQGFSRYDDEVSPSSAPMAFAERRGDATTQRAIAWLEKPRQRPFFAWVHYFDAHSPYSAPAPFAGRYPNRYDDEIAFLDHEVGRLLEALERIPERETFVVVAADHGEGMGVHGEWSHGLLVQEATLRIPLILYARSGLPAGLHVEARVSQVDLLPTILSLLGLEVPADLDGVDLTSPQEPDRPVLAETVEGRVFYGWARLAALYRGPLKYVGGPDPELYDLGSEPLEDNDRIASRAEDAAAMRRELEALQADAANERSRSGDTLQAADADRLAALGYVVAQAHPIDDEDQGPDPKTMLPLMTHLQTMVSDFGNYRSMPAWKRFLASITRSAPARSASEVIRELEKLAAEHPDFAAVYQYLTVFYRKEQRYEDAARAIAVKNRLRGAGVPQRSRP